jgi:putative SOS response-associated peptidase YedK
MCTRYALNENPRKLADHFCLRQAQAERYGDLHLSPSWNIAPSTRICSITADNHNPLSATREGAVV